MNGGGKQWETEFRSNDETVSISNPLISYPDSQIDGLTAEVWHEAKLQIKLLLDNKVPQANKEFIVAHLVHLFECLEREPPSLLLVDSQPPESSAIATNDSRISKSVISRSSDFNDRLRLQIQEFNDVLAHLGNKILSLKNKLQGWNQKPAKIEANELQICCNVHRNFRRILQKESRYLRDELYAAREVIQRLECRKKETSFNLIPYCVFKRRPIAFINVESDHQSLPYMTPMGSLTYGKFIDLQHAFMKRSSPVEVLSVASKSPKFVCSYENMSDVSSSVQQWVPPSINQPNELRLKNSTSDLM